MKYPEELPKKGTIKVLIRFDGYKDYYQNDTRRALTGESSKGKNFPQSLKAKGFEVEPRDFGLLRKSIGKEKRARSVGATHTYKYKVEDTEEVKNFVNKVTETLNDMKKSFWRKINLYFSEKISIETEGA